MKNVTLLSISVSLILPHFSHAEIIASWRIDSAAEWQQATKESKGLTLKDGYASPDETRATYQSVVQRFENKRRLGSITISQSPVWHNWEPISPVGPSNLADAPVFLAKGANDYWLFGRYSGGNPKRAKKGEKQVAFEPQEASLEGFDVPLQTTRWQNQFNAPGGLKGSKGGYHAWQSRDMKNWVHHGPVTEGFSRWVTTAEQVDGKTYIYYDYPNDQDPHLYIDDDLTDGKPGKNMGIAFNDPSDGSDCGFIRDLQGKFHVIYEDWSPINAKTHSWDSPLGGHAISDNGIDGFKIVAPAVDERTKPTGEFKEYLHPHWKQHPEWDSNVARYEVHQPEQHAYGDWACISIGGQYYLFCDYHPAHQKIRVGWFTSSGIDKQFTFCGEIGSGHPDPDIGFAEGKFWLINQTQKDYVSPGPWVEKVEARVGIDSNNDGELDQWSVWQPVKEKYDYIEGFSKQVKRVPATIDLSNLPAGFGVGFELRLEDTTKNASKPILDRVEISFTD